MRNFKLVLNTLWLVVYISVEGSDIDCTLNCACCKDGVCERGPYFVDECTGGCIDGYAGRRCYRKCPVNCMRCVTENNVETCDDCHNGYYPGPDRHCTSKCLPNCKTCSSGSSCTSCKEGYHNDNGSNDCRYRTCPGNCKCENDQCVYCINGYYDISNSCTSICPGNCVTCSSGTNCDSCKDGYYNGYLTDDSRHPLLNDCTIDCRDNCTQCSSYDVCSVCKTGLYGVKCDQTCSVGCSTEYCAIQTGNCDCSPSFDGDKCDTCQNGNYGEMCDKSCSTRCKDNLCDKDAGNCEYGCIVDTIVGDKCDVCITGWYGSNCNLPCSVGCKNKQCSRTDGKCTDGCLDNFTGSKCDLCINGKYGEYCKNDCPDNCDHKGCLKDSGNCIQCVQYLDGDKCNICVIGQYGQTCSKKCPSRCLNNACDRDSGTCNYGCVDNYSGDKCCVNNNNCLLCLSVSSCKQCKSGYFNDQCDERCPDNCLDSCNIVTGQCENCRRNLFGELCNSLCSSTCKDVTSAGESQCQQIDGKCLHGCNDGFYGTDCSKICSNFCKDRICNQNDGSCTYGCQMKVEDDLFCPLESASYSQEQSQNTAIILGIILAVSVAGNIILVATGIFLKCRKSENTNERTDRPFYENADMELKIGNMATVKAKTAQASISEQMPKTQDYEDLGRVQVSEHEYGQIRTHDRVN